MANSNNIVVTVGNNAYTFHDQTTDITICRGESVELTPIQRRSRRISMALAQGHLMLVNPVQTNEELPKYTDEDIEKLNKAVKAKYNKGTKLETIIKDINLDQAKLLAKVNKITLEEDDTVETIIKAILDIDD